MEPGTLSKMFFKLLEHWRNFTVVAKGAQKLKQYRNDQCGLVSTGLSVRTSASASPPTRRPGDHDLHTQSNFETSTPFLRHWSFRDQRRTEMTSCERQQSKVTL